MDFPLDFPIKNDPTQGLTAAQLRRRRFRRFFGEVAGGLWWSGCPAGDGGGAPNGAMVWLDENLFYELGTTCDENHHESHHHLGNMLSIFPTTKQDNLTLPETNIKSTWKD